MRRLRCKGEEDKGSHEDGSRIDPRGEVVINGVKEVEEGLASIDPSSTSISKRGRVSEDAGEGSMTRPTRYRQLLLSDGFGVLGQRKLLSSSVLVVGAGGIRSNLLLFLAASGMECIMVVDHDNVEVKG